MGTCNGKQGLTKQDVLRQKHYQSFISTNDYDQVPIVTLEQAVIPLIPFLPTIQTYVTMAKGKCVDPADGLTSDESASIMLYSMAWQPFNECLYVVLNTTLHSINQQNLQPWFLYLKLFFTAVLRLPSIYSTVYRTSKLDLSKQYEKDEVFTWWDFSLCTTLNENIQSNKIEKRTIFIIECHTIKDIHNHTYFPLDQSVLILPGTQFRVIECANQIINLQEIQASFLLQNVTVNRKLSLSRRFSLRSKDSRRLSSIRKSSTSNGNYRNVSLEQLIIEGGRGWTVDLDEQNINDRDMRIVVKYTMIKSRCKRIRLRDNNITYQGALILAEGLNHNLMLESLDLRNNYISDLGVEFLSFAIIHSNLKTLNLESNGITADGAEHLAFIIKNNRTLTELYLSKNHLGDRGMELLANALNDDKKNRLDSINEEMSNESSIQVNPSTLQHLYLGQNDITDVGIEYLAEMLKTNRMLTWLWLSGNEIGDRGVELLAHTLANQNLSLEWLFLNSNKSISDSSVDELINMLKRNHSLKTIYINNCNLSEMGKQKLQEFTKLKKDFDLEV